MGTTRDFCRYIKAQIVIVPLKWIRYWVSGILLYYTQGHILSTLGGLPPYLRVATVGIALRNRFRASKFRVLNLESRV